MSYCGGTMVVFSVYRLQQIIGFVVLAAVIVAGVQCSNHETEPRVMHSHEEGPMRIKAQSRISMLKSGTNGYGARVQIREDLHGRKHAHAMAVCDCNGQGPWRPLFKPSQILKTEFPEHEAFHEEVDSQYRSLVSEQVDNHLRSLQSAAQSSEHLAPGSDSSGGIGGSFNSGGGSFSGGSGSFSGGGGSFSGGGSGGGGGVGGGGLGGGGVGGGGVGVGSGVGLAKKHNHMIHLHLIPHIYVPIVHSSGFTEAKNYHTTVEDGSSSSSPNLHHSVDSSSSSEFQTSEIGGTSGSTGTTGPGENPSAAVEAQAPVGDVNENDHGGNNFNGHSGENTYYTITEDAVQHVHHDLHENYGNAIDNNSNNNHDYEVPVSNQVPVEEPHQYQVHEFDDLSKDYSNKKHTMSASTTVSKPQHLQQQQQQYKQRIAVRPNRAKHARKLTSRQDLKNLLVMRPPPVGQPQTWRYVYQPTVARHHQFYQRKQQLPSPPMMPLIKTRTVPLILHIRQRSDD